MITVGELYVNLGIKGAERTVGSLNGVKYVLNGVASTSLEAKAGIIAAMYALERLFAASGAAGTGLTNFNALTGISTKQLQQWQYAARQAGVSGQEVASSFKSAQSIIANMLMKGNAPMGYAMVADKLKNLGGFDRAKLQDMTYLAERLQTFSQLVPKDVGNEMIKSFGMSDGMIAAMRRNAFTPGAFAKAPTYGDQEITQLAKADVAWANIGNKIEMAFGHFNAKHGVEIAADFGLITDSVIKLAEQLEVLSERFKVLQSVGHFLEGIANTLKLGTELLDMAGGKSLKPGDILYDPTSKPGSAAKSGPVLLNGKPFPMPAIAPNVPALPSRGGESKVEVNQTLQFNHDGKDHQKNSDSHKKAVKDAYRQLQSQVQGS